jgi:hypothetical protein
MDSASNVRPTTEELLAQLVGEWYSNAEDFPTVVLIDLRSRISDERSDE